MIVVAMADHQRIDVRNFPGSEIFPAEAVECTGSRVCIHDGRRVRVGQEHDRMIVPEQALVSIFTLAQFSPCFLKVEKKDPDCNGQLKDRGDEIPPWRHRLKRSDKGVIDLVDAPENERPADDQFSRSFELLKAEESKSRPDVNRSEESGHGKRKRHERETGNSGNDYPGRTCNGAVNPPVRQALPPKDVHTPEQEDAAHEREHLVSYDKERRLLGKGHPELKEQPYRVERPAYCPYTHVALAVLDEEIEIDGKKRERADR